MYLKCRPEIYCAALLPIALSLYISVLRHRFDVFPCDEAISSQSSDSRISQVMLVLDSGFLDYRTSAFVRTCCSAETCSIFFNLNLQFWGYFNLQSLSSVTFWQHSQHMHRRITHQDGKHVYQQTAAAILCFESLKNSLCFKSNGSISKVRETEINERDQILP